MIDTIVDPVYLVALGVAVVAGLVILVTVYLSNRDTSYDKAVLEQRRQEQLATTDGNKAGKKDKEKKRTVAKKKDKKDKHVEVTTVEAEIHEERVISSIVDTKLEDPKEKQNDPRNDHVEFKVSQELVNIDDEVDAQLSKRKTTSSQDRPKKPILTNKANVTSNNAEVPEMKDVSVRGNTFDVLHPKDEYELIKSRMSEPTTPTLQKSPVTNGFSAVGHVIPPESSQPIVVGEKKKEKKKGTHKDIPIEQLTLSKFMELVKSAALNDEEIQQLVNELLNKNAEGNCWSQKNDPVANLKKSLSEAETALKTEKSNLESSLARVRELREELAGEKKAHLAVSQSVKRYEQELQKSQAYIHQLTEKHRNEIASLKNSLHAKQNEDRTGMARLQEENNRFKEVIQKVEAERSNLEAIPRMKHELEQMRNERRHREEAILSLQSKSDSLLQENQAIKEHLQTVTNALQQQEFESKQKITEMVGQLKDRSTLLEELKKTEERLHRLQKEHRDEISGLESSMASAKETLSGYQKTIDNLKSENVKLVDLKSALEKKLTNYDSLESNLREKDSSLSKFDKLVQEKDVRISSLEDELQNMRREVEELRVSQPNLPDSVPKEQLLQLENELNGCKSELRDLETQLKVQLAIKSNLEDVCKKLGDAGYSDVTSENLPSIISTILTNKSPPQDDGVMQRLSEQQESNASLLHEMEILKDTLRLTDEALKQIEKKAQEEQSTWTDKISTVGEENRRLSEENRQLSEEKKNLERTIKELQSLQDTFVDMEEKLKELQVKLQGEDSAKKELSAKLDEVSKRLSESETKFKSKSDEMEMFHKEKERIDELKASIVELGDQLEKEKKNTRELLTQNVKLKSLVKIGEDSLKAEQNRAEELVLQLKIKNGSGSMSSPCLAATNGTNGQSTCSSTSLNQGESCL